MGDPGIAETYAFFHRLQYLFFKIFIFKVCICEEMENKYTERTH